MNRFAKSFFLRNRFGLLFMIVIASACCLIGLYAMSSSPSQAPSQTEQQPPEPPAFLLPEVALGDTQVPHTVIMYFALDCTHCRHYEEKVLPEIKAQFIDTKQIRLILRDFPMGPAGLLASRICWARRDPKQYQDMVTKIFAKQEYWNVQEYQERLWQVALEAGLTEQELKKCITDKELEDAILWEKFQAKDIVEVPTFIIDGQPIADTLTPDVLMAFLANQTTCDPPKG